MTRREHRPAVGAAFGDVERLALLKLVQNGQIIDAALCPIGKTETRRSPLRQISVLDAYQLAFPIVVGYLQPIDAMLVPPRGESAPADDALVELALLEEKLPCRLAQEWMLEEAGVAGGVESGDLATKLGCRLRTLLNQNIVRIGEPTAGIEEILVQTMHHQVDGATRGTTREAAIRISSYAERQACVMVVVKRAKALVLRNLEPKSLCDPLDREVAELLKFLLVHTHELPLRYSSVLV